MRTLVAPISVLFLRDRDSRAAPLVARRDTCPQTVVPSAEGRLILPPSFPAEHQDIHGISESRVA